MRKKERKKQNGEYVSFMNSEYLWNFEKNSVSIRISLFLSLSRRCEQTEIVSGKITNRQSIRCRRNNNNRRMLDDAVIKIKLIGLVVCVFPYGNFRRRWLYSRRGVLCVIAYNALFILHSPSTYPFSYTRMIHGNPLLLSSLLFINLFEPFEYTVCSLDLMDRSSIFPWSSTFYVFSYL